MRKEAAQAEKDGTAGRRVASRARRQDPRRGAHGEDEGRDDDEDVSRARLRRLDGFEFLTMAEAGEVGHWSVLEELNKQARHPGVRDLVKVQLPIQRRHLKEAMAASVCSRPRRTRTPLRSALALGWCSSPPAAAVREPASSTRASRELGSRHRADAVAAQPRRATSSAPRGRRRSRSSQAAVDRARSTPARSAGRAAGGAPRRRSNALGRMRSTCTPRRAADGDARTTPATSPTGCEIESD